MRVTVAALVMAVIIAGAAILVGCGGASPGTSTRGSGPDPGETLVRKRCGTCHSYNFAYRVRYDRKGFEELVDRMIAHGARLNEAEREVVIEHLSNR